MFKKYRQLVVGIILGAIIFNVAPSMALSGLKAINVMYNNIKITVDGKEVKTDLEPFIYEDRTYVPIRVVSEALGVDVDWNDGTKTVEIIAKDNFNTETTKEKAKILSGVAKMELDNEQFMPDTEVVIYNNKAYVPAEDTFRALGIGAKWDYENRIFRILSDPMDSLPQTALSPRKTELPTDQMQDKPIILVEEFCTSGDMTGYMVGFSDGFMVALFNEKGTLPMSTYEYVAVSIMSEDKNMKTNINTPTIIGFSEVSGERYYPVSFTTYGRNIPEQYKVGFENNDFFRQFEKKDEQPSLHGMVYYDSFVMLDGIYYDDGIHKCTLYLKDKIR